MRMTLAALRSFLDGKPIYLSVDDEIQVIDSLVALATSDLEQDPATFGSVVRVLVRSRGGNWFVKRPDYVERYSLLRQFAERVRADSGSEYVRNAAANILSNTGDPD